MRTLIAALCCIAAGCAAPKLGNTCINAGQFVGDKIKHLETGAIGVVKKRYGESPRCADPGHPILADVEYP